MTFRRTGGRENCNNDSDKPIWRHKASKNEKKRKEGKLRITVAKEVGVAAESVSIVG